MRVALRTIIFVFLSLIFISKPLTVDASVATETVKNVASFYAESTSSLIDKADEKIYGVRDFYAPLFTDTARNLKGIFDGAFIVSNNVLNSVIALGRGTLDVGTYQIQNTGENVGSAVASAKVALSAISKKTTATISTTNVAVNELVKKVASSIEIPKVTNSAEGVEKKTNNSY